MKYRLLRWIFKHIKGSTYLDKFHKEDLRNDLQIYLIKTEFRNIGMSASNVYKKRWLIPQREIRNKETQEDWRNGGMTFQIRTGMNAQAPKWKISNCSATS